MRYDLVDLRLFLHVVAEGSITAGARQMHLSLPSASGRVRALEHHAGVPLLVRGRRGVRPTPAGTALARDAREVLARTARMESAVAGYASTATVGLRLLAGSSATHRLVPVALAGFLVEHPDVDVVAAERRSAQIVELLTAGEADLGVVLDDVALGAGLAAEPLGDDSLVVVAQAGGLLAGRTAVTFREVAEHPLVGLDADVPLRRAIEDNLGPHAPAAVTAPSRPPSVRSLRWRLRESDWPCCLAARLRTTPGSTSASCRNSGRPEACRCAEAPPTAASQRPPSHAPSICTARPVRPPRIERRRSGGEPVTPAGAPASGLTP